jgi:primosomal protein N' (replication factor Y)
VQQEHLPVRLLGPAPAILSKLRGLYRYHFQLVSEELEPIQHLWRTIGDPFPHAKDVEHTIDVDPVDLR